MATTVEEGDDANFPISSVNSIGEGDNIAVEDDTVPASVESKSPASKSMPLPSPITGYFYKCCL